jgi:branched-chain amino acid transport system permease protein
VESVRPARSVRAGLIGGAVAVYLALVGLIERFGELHLVGAQVTLGRVFIVLPPAVAAYVVMRPRTDAGRLIEPGTAGGLVGGTIAGLATGALVAGAVGLANLLQVERVREVFITASPTLLQFLTFDRGTGPGIVILVLLCTSTGALGGLARTLDPRIRRPVTNALAALLLLGLLQRIVPIAMDQLGMQTAWLYSPFIGGLTWSGGLLALAITAGLTAWWDLRGRWLRARLRPTHEGTSPASRLALVVIALAIVVVVPLLVGSVITQVLGTVAIFLLLGLGLNIVVGYAGLLDLGYVAFFAFGAYVLALLTGATLNTTTGSAAPAFSLHLDFYLAIWLVAALAAGLGVLIGAPVLRLRGDYLAIVTLGLGEIASILTQSKWLQPAVGGPQGMRDITDASIGSFGFRDPMHFYYLAVGFVVLALFVSWRLAGSRVGRAWNAMREDEQVADAMGISTIRYKLLAFAMGGAIGSLGGALFAVQIGSLTPASFTILVSITALAVVILGGLGSLPGVVVGAVVLIGLPGLLREFEEYRLLIYGAVLVAIMILRPQGLVPNVRRMRELHEEEVSQDEWARTSTTAEESAVPVAPASEVRP